MGKQNEKVRRNSNAAAERGELLGANMSFAAKEAYKLLRTNLAYILSENGKKNCSIIGVTSSLRGEGKSTTSLNLAYVLAEMDKRVLVIDADLRLPSLRKKLRVPARVGLSNLLIGGDEYPSEEFFLRRTEGAEKISYDVILSGDIPPNPSELLGSERMSALIDRLAEAYDYIILDLPPVTAVTDALVAAKIVDGLLVVVRSDYTDRGSLNEAIRLIQQVNGRILGFVMTCTNGTPSGYGKKYRYGYYKSSR